MKTVLASLMTAALLLLGACGGGGGGEGSGGSSVSSAPGSVASSSVASSSSANSVSSSDASSSSSSDESSSDSSASSSSTSSSSSSVTESSSSSSSVALDCSEGCFEEINTDTVRVRVHAQSNPGDIVDIHFKVNAGGQQNVRMDTDDDGWYYDIGGLNSADTIEANFTIIVGSARDTDWQTYIFVGDGSSGGSSSSSSSSTSTSSSSSSSPGNLGDCNSVCVEEIAPDTLRARVVAGDKVYTHYSVYHGYPKNVAMNRDDDGWFYDISGLNSGDRISVSFTVVTDGKGQNVTLETYYFAGTTPASSSSSSSSSSTISSSSTSMPADTIVPLYNATTALEEVIQYDRGDALVTRISDRGRDRHAKEDQFQAYDHYLSFYWEHRTAAIEIVDYVAKGGSEVRMNVRTEWPLHDREAENRWFYRGVNTVAEYCDNGIMETINDLNYYKARSYNCRENRAIQIGDKMEFELSQFLAEGLPNGRNNYYGTTYLYVVGEGLVQWDVGGATPFGGVEDSVKIDEQAWLGGATSIHAQTAGETDGHFMQLAGNLGFNNAQPFMLGRRVHHTSFVTGEHDEHAENGIFAETTGKAGTHYMNQRCTGCHERNGRAAPAPVGDILDKWVFKVADITGNPHPDLGSALQSKTTEGAASEGEVSIAYWTETDGLRAPTYEFSGVVPERFSARIAPQLVGIGLLEAIPEATIMAMEDINDLDGNGISGKINRVVDPVTGATRAGRFGWKASTTSVRHQLASAFNIDMGVMTSVLPTPDCGANQLDCGASGPELSDEQLDNLVKYISLLGVRPQRNYNDPAVQSGAQIFATIGCTDCHTPSLQTSEFHPFAELRDQTIHPYTDMLLHDMGPGLADSLGDGDATGAEWRTAPLWGLGLSACVTGGIDDPTGAQGDEVCTPVHTYLHDGRARSIEEAILWHGGESEAVKAAYQVLSDTQKQNVLRFLESL